MRVMYKNKSITELILWLLICSYIVFFGLISYLKYTSFAYFDFDLAHHSQTMWNILHGSIYCSVLGVDFLGNHAHFILFLVAPLYFLFQSPLTLLYLQTFSLALAAYPIYLIGKKELGGALALSVAFAYLIYPSLGHVNLFEFHPTVFATLFLSFMFYFFVQGYFKRFILFMFLSLLCQENISLIIIALGIYIFFTRKSIKWSIVPIITGVLWFWLMVIRIIPYFNKETIHFFSIYNHLGASFYEVTKAIITNPITILKMLSTKNNIIYLMHLFIPVSFLPLFCTGILILIPLLMQHLLSARWIEHTIYAHYTAEMLPIIFVSTIYGLKRVLKFSSVKRYFTIRVFTVLITGVAITSNIYLGPHLETVLTYKNITKDIWDYKKESFINMIPKDAAVIATFEFLPKLSHRKNLYSFHHVVSGFYTLSMKSYQLPEDIEYALLDFNDKLIMESFYKPEVSDVNLRNFFHNNNWGVIDTAGNIVLLKKDHVSEYPLYQVLNRLPHGYNRVAAIADDTLELIGYITGDKEKNQIKMSFFWRVLKEVKKNYWGFIDIVDKDGEVRYRFIKPICYGIYPYYAWKKENIVKENYNLILPDNIEDSFSIKIGIFNYKDKKTCPFVSLSPDGVDDEGRINLKT